MKSGAVSVPTKEQDIEKVKGKRSKEVNPESSIKILKDYFPRISDLDSSLFIDIACPESKDNINDKGDVNEPVYNIQVNILTISISKGHTVRNLESVESGQEHDEQVPPDFIASLSPTESLSLLGNENRVVVRFCIVI